ncbi:MAG: AI-2E family transporter [Ignavibacteria bacterium]|nr:AI-2E family transporter [Bacteroidota bacterium]MSQ45805.1 AI-2E family transporter [Ignavibacteria bacterium]
MQNFFQSRLWKVLLVTILITLPIVILSQFGEVFLILVLSVALTMVTKPLIDKMEKQKISRTISILIFYLFVGSIVGVSGFYLFPMLLSQIENISAMMHGEKLDLLISSLVVPLNSILPFIDSTEVSNSIKSAIEGSQGNSLSMASTVMEIILMMVLVPLVTFFLLNDYYKIQKSIIENVPNKYFEMALNMIYKLELQLSKYIRGVVTESFIVTILYTICYSFVGIQYAFLLGIIGGVLNIIPFAGPFIAVIPVIFSSMLQYGDLRMFVPILIINVIVQQLDELFIQPKVYGKILHMHPLVIILAILIGNELLGILGMILAIPMYTIISVTIKETNWGLKNYRITQL